MISKKNYQKQLHPSPKKQIENKCQTKLPKVLNPPRSLFSSVNYKLLENSAHNTRYMSKETDVNRDYQKLKKSSSSCLLKNNVKIDLLTIY